MIRIVVALVAAGALACNGDPDPKRPAEPASPASASGAALPVDQQCLPASICEQWSGCALVARGAQFWTVIAADQFPAGEPVEVKNLCPGSKSCIAARGIPKGAPCPDLRTPVLVEPPPYACVWDGRACARRDMSPGP